MKNLLITGNVSSLAAHLCQRLSRQYHMVVAAHQTSPIAFGKGVEVLLLADQKTLEQVFQAHSFQAMVFLATRGEQQTRVPGETDQLGNALALAKRHGIDKVLYLASGELSRPAEALSERGMLLQAMEQLCLAYRKQGMDVTIVRLPCVFGPGETDTLIGRMLIAAARGETAALPFARDAQMDFISAAEVAQLVYRLLERVGPSEELLLVRGAEVLTVRELTALFGLLGASVSQGTGETGYPPMEGSDYQRSYGFTPSDRLSVALDNLYLGIKTLLEKQDGQRNRIRSYLRSHSALVKGASLLLGYVAMEALQLLKDAGQFPAVDLRLLYVVLIGAAHGLQTGLFAIVFASFSAAREYGAQGADILALLNDWKTWIPFVVLILAGIFTGYARDKGRREARLAQETTRTLEKRCSFLQDLYKQSLLSKDEPVKQEGEKQERLELQLAQLRQGQERLEQEWLMLLKREQARWDSLKAGQDDMEEAARKERLRAEEALSWEKAHVERQARLKQALLDNALQEEKDRKEQAAAVKLQPSKEPMNEMGLPQPSQPLVKHPNMEEDDDGLVLDLSGRFEEEEPKAQGSHEAAGGTDTPAKKPEPIKPIWANPSLEKDRVILGGSPLGKLTPAERRRMLESMQVRSKRKPAEKPKRQR